MPKLSLPEDRIPVIVGIGEIVDRPKEIAAGLEPLALLEQALQRAEADSGAKLLAELGSLDVVNFLSWRYRDPEKQLAARIGAKPAHLYYGPVGGESPIRYLHEAALRIARGECSVAAVCGAEAQSTATKAQRAGIELPWTPFAHDVEEPKRGAAFQKPLAVTLGAFRPITVYPLYETATAAHWGQTPREALQESGKLWSTYSAVAAENPNSWLKKRFMPDEITTPTPDNRLIAWPYTKLMVANPTVNMGGALLMTSLAKARAAGIAEDRMIYPLGGASAEEPRDYLVRDQFFESHPQNAVLRAVMDLVEGDGKKFDAIELYSCFPCVPKAARRVLGLGLDRPLTVSGGLTFAGGPGGNYMTHAAAAMVERLREPGGGTHGFLLANGGWFSDCHCLVLSREAPRPGTLPREHDVQEEADAARGRVPPFLEHYAGPGRIETYTVIHGRDGSPAFGTVIGRTPADERFVARVPAEDSGTIALLTSGEVEPIGHAGRAVEGMDGRVFWRA